MPTTPDRRELFQRYEGNPLIRASDFPRMVNATFNPAAVEIEGDTLLLVRVEEALGALAPRGGDERQRADRLGARARR